MTGLLNRVTQGDCLEVMREIPDKSVDLIVIDPPYNIGKDKRWDKWRKVDDYVLFMTEVFKECERVLKPTGSFYWFHNDMAQIRRLMDTVDSETELIYKNFIVWNKRYSGSPRKYYFDNVIKTESSRSYRPLSEYCLFYTFQESDILWLQNKIKQFKTPELTYDEIGKRIGISGTAVKHWFDYPTQPRFPSKDNFEKLREIVNIPFSYEELREEYEKERYTYNHQATHHDVWNYEVAPKIGHVTPKPVDLIENILRHSSNEGDVVLDCFLGSGTTAIAAINTGRQFIGIERESEYVEIANRRISEAINTERRTL